MRLKLRLLVLLFLICGFSAFAQVLESQTRTSISGSVVDTTGAPISGAHVTLSSNDKSLNREATSSADGTFSFAEAAAGSFRLAISAKGFTGREISVAVQPGQAANLPPVTLTIATVNTDVEVRLTQADVAQEQIQVEEKQRLLGFVPNYYVSYVPNAAPLASKQKFQLTGRFVLDPVSFGITAIIAGVQQEQNDFKSFGQGAEGYAKRYGAAYANFFTGFVLSSAVLPAILKQDPRYFYKGTGTKRSRILYALATAVTCKGDNGRWQPNYSNILGGLAAAGISNLYYPAKDRNGAGLTLENALIGVAGTAAGNLFQEFFSRKLTPSASKKP